MVYLLVKVVIGQSHSAELVCRNKASSVNGYFF
jgi:hypothetical protein